MTYWQILGVGLLAWFGAALGLVALMVRWGARDKRTRWNREGGE